jgi:transposase
MAVNENKKESRKNHEGKVTVEKTSPHERQRIVYVLELQGLSNKEISKKLGVSMSTVEKDLRQIREMAKDWFLFLTSSGMAKSLADACVQLDEAQKEFWRMYRASDDKQVQIKILNSIVDASMKKKDLFWTTQQDPYNHGYGLSPEDLWKRML